MTSDLAAVPVCFATAAVAAGYTAEPVCHSAAAVAAGSAAFVQLACLTLQHLHQDQVQLDPLVQQQQSSQGACWPAGMCSAECWETL